jgi:hypothetical protein
LHGLPAARLTVCYLSVSFLTMCYYLNRDSNLDLTFLYLSAITTSKNTLQVSLLALARLSTTTGRDQQPSPCNI